MKVGERKTVRVFLKLLDTTVQLARDISPNSREAKTHLQR